MRILQVIPSISLVYGGPSQMILGLSKALAEAGVEVTIITTNANGDTGQLPLDVPLGIPISQDGYQIIYFKCAPFRRYKFSWDLLSWLFNHAQNYDVAHIHALFSPVSTAAATVARIKKLPYILRPLGTLDPADLRKKSFLKQIYGYLLEKPNLAGAAAVHFTSDQECKVSERFGAVTKDIVIPLGVDLPAQLPPKGLARQQWGIKAELPLLLFMSRFDRKKGLDLLIPALEGLFAKGLRFRLVLAGANPQDEAYEQEIEQRIEDSALHLCTTITGFVRGDDKLALLQDADLFVLPSYYENFGIAVAEAMIMGTPVVISDQVYIWEDIIEGDAGWVSKCQVRDLRNKLILALQDPELIVTKGENARKLAQIRYSWSAIAQSLIEVYHRFDH